MEVDGSCLLVLTYCRFENDTEICRAMKHGHGKLRSDAYLQVFGVLRVAMQNWADVKREHPEQFQLFFKENQ